MKLGVIADDFTGASDIALTLSEGGMTVSQFVGVPDGNVGEVDAGVVSTKIRTAPVSVAVAQALEACEWLLSEGCGQIVWKICSTFDSTDAGNIGPVAEALARRVGESTVVVCPAFPKAGRSVYQGHLFVGDRLLNESGMQNHPLTPMTDPDLRRVLGRQTSWPVTHVPYSAIAAGTGSIADAVELAEGMVIVDAIRSCDLLRIGQASKSRRLLCGGSGIALGLPANFGHQPRQQAWTGRKGRGVVLAGSCSVATLGQIERYRDLAPSLRLDPADVMSGKVEAAGCAEWVLAQGDAVPLVYTSLEPGAVRAAQDRFGAAELARTIETLFAGLAVQLVRQGYTRIVTAGGETSGAVVGGLNVRALRVGPKIAEGVPALRVDGIDLALALKSGNFGGPDFFERALAVLEGSE